jgi:hypothetical protein
MSLLRQISVWAVLASYLLANTLAASWHTHGHACCRHSEPGQQQGHHPAGATQCHHHGHGHAHSHDHCHKRCQDQRRGADDDQSPAPHHCAVCEFLALAPLPAPVVELQVAREAIPAEVSAIVESVCSAPLKTHLARGPPALS